MGGMTILDSLDTLYLAGMEQEFSQGLTAPCAWTRRRNLVNTCRLPLIAPRVTPPCHGRLPTSTSATLGTRRLPQAGWATKLLWLTSGRTFWSSCTCHRQRVMHASKKLPSPTRTDYCSSPQTKGSTFSRYFSAQTPVSLTVGVSQ